MCVMLWVLSSFQKNLQFPTCVKKLFDVPFLSLPHSIQYTPFQVSLWFHSQPRTARLAVLALQFYSTLGSILEHTCNYGDSYAVSICSVNSSTLPIRRR